MIRGVSRIGTKHGEVTLIFLMNFYVRFREFPGELIYLTSTALRL